MLIRKLKMAAIVLGTVSAISFAAAPSYAASNNGQRNGNAHGYQAKSIAGSWITKITFGGSSASAMYSFHQDGTMTEADNPGFDPGFGGNALSPGLGNRSKVSRRSAEAVYQKLAYDTAGTLQQVYESTMMIERQSDGSISGTVSIKVMLPDGTLLNEIPDLPFTGTLIGTN